MILASELVYVASGTLRNTERRRYQNLSPRRTILSAGTSARPEDSHDQDCTGFKRPAPTWPFSEYGQHYA